MVELVVINDSLDDCFAMVNLLSLILDVEALYDIEIEYCSFFVLLWKRL